MSRVWKSLPYAVALVSVGCVAALLHHYPWLFERGAFALLLGCTFLSTFLGGWRAGVLALGASVFVSAWLMSPSDSLWVASLQDWVRLAILIVVGSMIAVLHASRERAVQRSVVSESRLRTALNAARMAAWEKDLRTGEFWFSPGLAEIFGRTPGTFHHSYEEFVSYIHPDDRNFVQNAFTRSVESGMEFEVEHRIVRPDGGERWIITRGQIVYGPTGQGERLLAVAVDVTDRHLARSGQLGAVTPGRMDDVAVARPGRL
jgi:PAS domain S-box-containing protein